MNLFGCKFCDKLPDGSVKCDRKNFDSLLWALVTVFQVHPLFSSASLVHFLFFMSFLWSFQWIHSLDNQCENHCRRHSKMTTTTSRQHLTLIEALVSSSPTAAVIKATIRGANVWVITSFDTYQRHISGLVFTPLLHVPTKDSHWVERKFIPLNLFALHKWYFWMVTLITWTI